ncbi:Lipoxygenase 4 [Hibiscus syriacus]|uniref:Lipoxygenase n=1 Tax=Hibiscus syriacus TaxID=106335 RepID=A0A6A3CIT4_HIBSY|nr:Lipoxygenase 4 [Hibiscus syriacus]
MIGCSLIERSSFVSSSKLFLTCSGNARLRQNRLLQVKPVSVPSRKVSPVVAAISEDLIKAPLNQKEKSVKFKVRAAVTIRNKNKEDFKETLVKLFDAFTDMFGRNVVLELISNEQDPKTKGPKKISEAVLKDWSKKANVKTERAYYTAEFTVESDFGIPGAITVTNKHQQEFLLESITTEGFACGPLHFPCNSWVQSTKNLSGKRIFFSNQPYLPNDTPKGLIALRENELRDLRGDGRGVRKLSDRVYDYDVYNDLGNPDRGIDFARPTLGVNEIPYPRRCRTGRLPSETGEYISTYIWLLFLHIRNAFSAGRLRAVLHNLLPQLKASISVHNRDINSFADIDDLYKEGLLNLNDEFGRQALAGVNPVNIERLTSFPPVSKLDPEIYGPQKSALKEEHIVGQLNGMTVQQALDEKKLFIVDYHDIYLPFLDRINALDGRKSYATRTIFFLTPTGSLKPIAIELSLPYTTPQSRAKRVVTPPVDATTNWIWQLAKAHVCSNDAGVHQLVNHWLRTHACMEPFILSAHRQMSAMHPIFKLLDPHMRYTLEINALARQNLINADGIIENCFTPGRYCMEMSAAAYRSHWRFDLENLPADLMRSDRELQNWYHESIHVGHADLSDESWWPSLKTPDDLVSILTTLIWLASAQHAALNFGQYPYGGYVPNRPPLMRRLIPDENDPEYANFLSDPQKYFLLALPSLLQATKFMAVVDNLSTHSPDEEYLGERQHPSIWSGDAEIIEAFYRFSAEIRQIEKKIEKRNADPNLKNRCGAGVLPYELLDPSSDPGVTCRGVPNSVSI